MKIVYKHGDLMKATEPFVAQGCNAQGVMGSGIAKLIRAEDENVYTEYRKVYEQQGNKLHLGQVIPVKSGDRVYLNCITQEFYGRDPARVYVSYEAVREATKKINSALSQAVAMPLIGAGLGHGSWKIISEIIEEESTNFQPVVYLFDGIIPDGVVADVIPV